MDLWDVIRVVVRRWYVSVPMILLTVAALVWVGMTVSPNHTAEAHAMVLPPVSHPNPEPGEEPVVNPWTTDSLAGAIVTTLRNHNLAEQLEAEGYRASWEVGLDLQFQSVIVLEVTSPTKHEAQDAASRLLQQIGHEVDARQAEFDIPDTEKITMITLSQGENVEVVRGNQVRALVVVFGAGAILTMALAIGTDAIARRRAAGSAPGPERDREPAAAPRYPTNGVRPAFTGVGSALGAEHRPEADRGGPPAPSQAGSAATGPAGSGPPANSHSGPGITVSYRPPPEHSTDPPRGGTADLEDATIVLPLSGTGLGRRDRPEPPPDGLGSPKAQDR